jgi:hypothetical protein
MVFPPIPGLRPGVERMPSEVEQYRANAEECAQRAEKATDPEVKAAFKKVEREWLEMARLSEDRVW